MNLISIESAVNTQHAGAVDLVLTADVGNGPEQMPYTWIVGDPHGLGPKVDAWMVAHPNFTISAYVAPQPSTDPNHYPLRPDQFFAMLEIAGLTATANAAIDAIADPTQKIIARAKFNHTPMFNRDNPLVAQLSTAAGLTSAQVDALWLRAKDIP